MSDVYRDVLFLGDLWTSKSTGHARLVTGSTGENGSTVYYQDRDPRGNVIATESSLRDFLEWIDRSGADQTQGHPMNYFEITPL